jgi:hypothetical protein
MAESTDIQQDLQALGADLKRLEGEYAMFFSGRLARPPWETRARVESTIKRWARGHISATSDRFRFQMLQSRFQSLKDLWDRALRAREEGRSGPFVGAAGAAPAAAPAAALAKAPARPGQSVHVTSFTDPVREIDKLHVLYDTLMEARRTAGDGVVPFHKFAALVSSQVEKMREGGSAEVAFRVAVTDGKVNFTVRGLKGAQG